MNPDQLETLINQLYQGHKPKTGPGSGVPSFVFQMLSNNVIKTRGTKDPNQTVAVVADKAKTAAICYDRVFSFGAKVPDEISLYVPTRTVCIVRLTLFLAHLHSISAYSESDPETFASDAKRLLVTEFKMPPNLCDFSGNKGVTDEFFELFLTNVLRRCAEDLWSEYKMEGTPVYSTRHDRDSQYSAGDHGVILSYLDNLEVVDEENTTWEQVMEFRKDTVLVLNTGGLSTGLTLRC
jgi:hypothetical protein